MKFYVLDTSVLIHSPYSIFAFDKNTVCLCDTTLEELDKLKKFEGETGYNARETCRILDDIISNCKSKDNVYSLENGGKLQFLSFSQDEYEKCKKKNSNTSNKIHTLSLSCPDNYIIMCAKILKINTGEKVILVSKDISMRVKAKAIDLKVKDFTTEDVSKDKEAYTGRRELFVSSEILDKFFNQKYLDISDIEHKELIINEFLCLIDECNISRTALARFDGNRIVPLRYQNTHPYGVTPKNMGQRFAIEALLTDAKQAPLVIISGPAGTAKTFLSLACGLEKTFTNDSPEYRKILITRPNIKLDEDIGFLKGDEMEKITPLIRPCLDNLEVLTDSNNPKKKRERETEKSNSEMNGSVQYLFDKGVVTAQALAYLRGRSLTNHWTIVEEAQNATPLQILTIITRAGLGSKIILIGDPNQIDAPKLDKKNNGLVYAAEKMKGSKLCWQLELEQDECTRSELAMEAADRLPPKGYKG